jgi:uncharacterized protein
MSFADKLEVRRPCLLDINVLIALFDSAHVHHRAAHDWFAQNIECGWRICPLTENGFLRILSHPGYPGGPLPILDLAARLEEFKHSALNYGFWPDDVSLSESLHRNKRSLPAAKVTDAYLLKLCSIQRGALATFDSGINASLIGLSDPELVELIAG